MRMEFVGSEETVSLSEFIALADRLYDPQVPSTAWDLRQALAGLARDPAWIFPIIAERQRQRMNSAWAREQPSYFVLHISEHYVLRANIWLPQRYKGQKQVLENAAFSYDFPHDHNFDILTATCIGPGYETDIYSYDEIPADADVGDIIPVEGLGRNKLSPGMVFLYEACRDVHTQLPVEDVTVTLNFLPVRAENYARPQFIFDCVASDKLKVIGVPLSPEGRQMSAVRMLAKLLPDHPQLRAPLERIGGGHANPRVAAYAAERLRIDAEGTMDVDLVAEIEDRNVAFKYHEVAELSRQAAA